MSTLPAGISAGDPILDLLKDLAEEEIPAAPGDEEQVFRKNPPRFPCPEGRECRQVASFLKPDYRSEAKRFEVGGLTANRGYEKLVLLQRIGEKHGVILNTVKVRSAGRWTPYTQGIRLPEGRTELAVPVPQGTDAIVISFDHGRGAEVDVLLERDPPQPRRLR